MRCPSSVGRRLTTIARLGDAEVRCVGARGTSFALLSTHVVDIRHLREVSMNVPSRQSWFRTGLGLVLAGFAIQFVPYGHHRVNPVIAAEPAWDSPATRALAKQACFDCHSNETEWPAYSRVAPVSWLIRHDVSEGRAVLNFSEWQRPQKEAKEARTEILEREMPPRIYQLMHAEARLSDADRERLARGIANTLAQPVAAADGLR
jgi:mono/diheme cytochrome c family protein